MLLTTFVLWVLTALVGGYMLAIVARTGRAGASATRSRLPTPLLLLHPALGLTGLVLWVLYMNTGSAGLAWAAFVFLLGGAGVGDVMALRWWRGRKGGQPRGAVAEQQIPLPAVVTHGVLAGATLVLVFLGALGFDAPGTDEPVTRQPVVAPTS